MKKENKLKRPNNFFNDNHMNLTLQSNDSSQFHSCTGMNMSQTNFHDALEVQLEESHIEMVSNVPSNLKNVFQFT